MPRELRGPVARGSDIAAIIMSRFGDSAAGVEAVQQSTGVGDVLNS